jgi:phage gpG-like protein
MARNTLFTQQIQSVIAKRMDDAGAEIVRQSRDLLEQGGSGPEYEDRRQASAPGEPPVTQSGELADSLSHETVIRGDTIATHAGTSLFYGRMLEGGTARMEPRPYLQPAVIGPGRDSVVRALKGGSQDA